MEEKSNTKTVSLADQMIDRIRKALNAEARERNAPRRYRQAESLAMGEDMEEEDD